MGGGPRFQAPFSAALLVLKGSWSGLEMGPRWVAPPKRGCSSAPPSPPPRPVRLSSRPCVTWLSLKAKIPTSPSRKHLSLADISVPSIRAAASPSFPLAGKRSPMGSSHPQPPPPWRSSYKGCWGWGGSSHVGAQLGMGCGSVGTEGVRSCAVPLGTAWRNGGLIWGRLGALRTCRCSFG